MTGPTGSPTTRKRRCTGGKSGPVSTSSWASRKPTSPACSVSWERRGAAGVSRCCRSACCTTRSSNVRLSPGRSASTRAGSPILVGTPSGVTLAPEGGAHQSVTTPSVGIEQPGCVSVRARLRHRRGVGPARVSRPTGQAGRSLGLPPVVHRPVDQGLAAVPADPAAREARRRQTVAGAYRLRRTPNPRVTIAAMGAVMPEALAAAERLDAAGSPGGRRLRDQPRPAVQGATRQAGPCGRTVLDPGPGVPRLPRHPAGHRPRRAPAHARVPGHRQPGPWHYPRRDPVSASPGPSRTSTATTGSTPTASSARPLTRPPRPPNANAVSRPLAGRRETPDPVLFPHSLSGNWRAG